MVFCQFTWNHYNQKMACETYWMLIVELNLTKSRNCLNVRIWFKWKRTQKRGSMVNYDAVMQLKNQKDLSLDYPAACLILFCTQSAVLLVWFIYNVREIHISQNVSKHGEQVMSISVISCSLVPEKTNLYVYVELNVECFLLEMEPKRFVSSPHERILRYSNNINCLKLIVGCCNDFISTLC